MPHACPPQIADQCPPWLIDQWKTATHRHNGTGNHTNYTEEDLTILATLGALETAGMPPTKWIADIDDLIVNNPTATHLRRADNGEWSATDAPVWGNPTILTTVRIQREDVRA